MSFIKDRTIYKGKTTHVYINECRARGRKTRIFAVRRDDNTGYGELLGLIKFDGGWRQYILFPESNTKWTSGCKRAICDFEDEITLKWRKSLIGKTNF